MDLKLQFYRVLPIILWMLGKKRRISLLRKVGVKIGEGSLINPRHFSTEPYLIEIGNNCALAAGTKFFTHDGGVWTIRDEMPDIDRFGKIKVGNNVFIGSDCIILPDTTIGDNCVVGAGSVLRGKFEENSVIMGNPAKKILSLSAYKILVKTGKGLMKTKHLKMKDKEILLKKKLCL